MDTANYAYLESHRKLSREHNGDGFTSSDASLLEGIRSMAGGLGWTDAEIDADMRGAAHAVLTEAPTGGHDDNWGDYETGDFC